MVTGASSGIGRATALRCAAKGAAVVLAARRGEVLEEVARGCQAVGGMALPVSTEVTDANAVQALARQAPDRAAPRSRHPLPAPLTVTDVDHFPATASATYPLAWI